MKHVEIPIEGGRVEIDSRAKAVTLVLAVEDGSRTVRVRLYGSTADHAVGQLVRGLTSVTQDVLDELSKWVE